MTALQDSAAGRMIKLARAELSLATWSLLDTTPHLRCAEARDEVFAILSMLQAGHDGIVVDYTIPLPLLLNTFLRNRHTIEAPGSLDEVEAHGRFLELNSMGPRAPCFPLSVMQLVRRR